MQNFFQQFDFSIYSLLAFSCLPLLSVYLRQFKDWAFPCSVIIVIAAVLVIVKIPSTFDSRFFLIFAVCHLLACVSAIFLLYSQPLQKVANNTGKKADKSNSFKQLNKKNTPGLSWRDVIIDEALKKELQLVIQMLKDPSIAKNYGIDLPKGMLFTGPPGNGKTTIAKVIAATANLSFFVLNSTEVVSKWVGDSEKNLSALFDAAQRQAPAIVFIDEIDAIGRARSGDAQATERLLNHFLQLIDGVIQVEGIYIIGATNRPQSIDAALKRPGRLNRIIEIPPPNTPARIQMFKVFFGKMQLTEGLNVEQLAQATDGFSGADIKEICNQAGINAFARESHLPEKQRQYKINQDDIKHALKAVKSGHALQNSKN